MLRKPTQSDFSGPGIAQHDLARVLPVTHASGRRRLSAELGHWACVISIASSRGMRTSAIHDASPRFSAIVNAPNRSNRSVPDPGAPGGRSEEGPNLLAHIIAVLRRNGMTLHDWRVSSCSIPPNYCVTSLRPPCACAPMGEALAEEHALAQRQLLKLRLRLGCRQRRA